MEAVPFILVMLGVAFGAPLWAMWRWHGYWRLAAALPAVAMASMMLWIAIGLMRDPTAYNLWPLGILMWGAVGSVYIGVLGWVRRFLGVEED